MCVWVWTNRISETENILFLLRLPFIALQTRHTMTWNHSREENTIVLLILQFPLKLEGASCRETLMLTLTSWLWLIDIYLRKTWKPVSFFEKKEKKSTDKDFCYAINKIFWLFLTSRGLWIQDCALKRQTDTFDLCLHLLTTHLRGRPPNASVAHECEC